MAKRSLEDLKYRDLQKLAKRLGIRANQKRAALIDDILAASRPGFPRLRLPRNAILRITPYDSAFNIPEPTPDWYEPPDLTY